MDGTKDASYGNQTGPNAGTQVTNFSSYGSCSNADLELAEPNQGEMYYLLNSCPSSSA